MAIPPSGKTEMIAANRARAAANRETRRGEKETQVRTGRAGPEKSTGAMRYPLAMMDSSTDYLRIQIAEYVPPGVNLSSKDNKISTKRVDDKGKPIVDAKGNETEDISSDFSLRTGTTSNQKSLKKPKHTILLPIPKQLSDTSGVNWGDSTLSALEAFGLSATSATMKEGLKGGLNTIMSTKDAFKDVAGDSQFKDAVIAALAGEAVGVLGGNVSGRQLVSRATGQVFNPNLELLFDGVNIRSFPFSFEFFPRNPKEGEMVKRIIRTLKQSMLAKRDEGGGKIFISAPDIFQLTYMKGNRKHPFLNSFLPMALTNINISYTGSNTYSTFYDGTPTHMRMDLTFKELNPIYAEDYNGVGGVGY
jgi:hypothetical protein